MMSDKTDDERKIRKWYFSLSEASLDRRDHGWRSLARVAVTSALKNTSLRPYMLYDGQDSEFTGELRAMGVIVILHRVSFYEQLVEAARARGPDYLGIALGAFPRVEIPWVEKEDDVVLYTDCDVVFVGDPQFAFTPEYFAAAPQTSQTDYDNDLNSGVMLLNVRRLRQDLPRFINFITDHLSNGSPGFDQENYRRFYKGKWDRLDLTLNWKPYWGENPAAKIVHWHGAKPQMIRRLLTDPSLNTNTSWKTLFDGNRASYRRHLQLWEAAAANCRRDILGHLDALSERGGGGWAFGMDDPGRPVKMTLLIDNMPTGTVVCDQPRSDIKAAYGIETAGFNFTIAECFNDGKPHKLELRDEGGFLISLKRGGSVCDCHWFSSPQPRIDNAPDPSLEERGLNRSEPQRAGWFYGHLDRSMSIVEIGASHQPLVPKAGGWNTTVVDHVTEAELKLKYFGQVASIADIEPVDIVWNQGSLSDKFPPGALGTYHAVIASHVLEHLPDPISFLKSCEALLRPDGKIFLALPDKRHCFDFFGQLTLMADWLTAYNMKAETHSKRTAFNHVAYAVKSRGMLAWGDSSLEDPCLVHTLDQAIGSYRAASDQGSGVYADYHAWRFTPASFALLMLETAYVAGLDLRARECTTAIGHEFFVVIDRGRDIFPTIDSRERERLRLLKATISELASQAAKVGT